MTHSVKIIYGPTASGKSASALEIAAHTPSVIINADAMQCYNALSTLTAQPSLEEQNQAPHKLYGFVDPSTDMVVTDWRHHALKEIYDALNHNLQPILVGGTGFYLKALMEGLSLIPPIPRHIRDEAEEIIKKHGTAPLLKDIKSYCADDLNKFDIHNPRRIIRAWEVLKHTGQSIFEWHIQDKNQTPPDLTFDLRIITRPRAELIARINKRFDHMLDQNILAEVQDLASKIDQKIVREDNLITKAHGFRPLRSHLNGEQTLEEAAERSKIETRQYAKRQMTWARQQFGYTAPS